MDIQVSRNAAAELASASAFARLQEEIYNQFGIDSPTKPHLRIRNATQTSVVLEWDPINLATATLRSLTLYRNGAKTGSIPNATTFTSTKISGLAVNTEYTFHLVLKTSAGTYSSDKVTVKTQKLTDLSGITVCPGVMPPDVKEQLEATLTRIGAKPLQDYVRIDTTHFVCTEGRGQAWERAVETNIPIVRPEWVDACESEGRIVGVRAYYLTADPRLMRPTLRERGQRPGTAVPGQQHPQQQQSQPQQQPDQQPKNSLDQVALQATAASTPAQTPVLQQDTPPPDDPETKDSPTVQQQPSEEVSEKQDEVAGTEVQDESHSHATEEVDAGSDGEGEVRKGEHISENIEKESGPVPVPPDVVSQLEEKAKAEEGFETVSL